MEQEEIGVLKKETKSLCRILGEMQQELDVLKKKGAMSQ